MQKLRSFIISVLKFLYIAPLREAFITLHDLPLGMRVLGWAGYVGIAFLLVVMIISVIPGVDLNTIVFSMSGDSEGTATYVPLLVVIAGLLGLLLGWAYLLTGATNGKPAVFLPLAFLFCLQLACLVPVTAHSGIWWFAWACVVPPSILAIMIGHLLTHRKAFWRDHPLLEFGLWLLILGLSGLFMWLGREGLFEMTAGLNGMFSLLFLLLVPLWFLLGLSIVDLGLELASRLVLALRRWFPLHVIQALTIFVLVARPALLLIWYLWDSLSRPTVEQPSLLASGILIDGILSIPLLIALLVIALRRRWDGYRAAKLLVISLTFLVFSIGIAFAMGGIDLSNPLELTMQGIGVLPSIFVFVTMLVYNVLGIGAKFARGDSRWLPREGRILLVFGLALLVTSLVTFMTNLRDEAGQLITHWDTEFSNFFALGLILLGLPYLIWIIWKRGERLVGSRADFEAVTPRYAALSAAPSRRLAVVAVLIALAVLFFICLLALLIQ